MYLLKDKNIVKEIDNFCKTPFAEKKTSFPKRDSLAACFILVEYKLLTIIN